MSAIQHRTYTLADLELTPDDGKRYEIIDGELFVSAAPVYDHQKLIIEISFAFKLVSNQTDAGVVIGSPVDVVFADDSVVQPDLLFIRAEREAALAVRGKVMGAPDIVVEVISPSSERTDRVRKHGLYERFGVPEYWLFDLGKREVIVHVLVEGRYQSMPANPDGSFTSRVLPELTIEPGKLFALVSHRGRLG